MISCAPLWIALALCSAGMLGFYDLLKKLAVRNAAPHIALWISTVAGWLLLLPLYWGSGAEVIGSSSSFFVRQLTLSQHAAVLVKAGIVSASWLLSFWALQRLPLSLAAPLRASSPVFTGLLAVWWFGERPSMGQGLGLAFIFYGYFGLARVGRKEGIVFEANRAVFALMVATLLGAVSGLYDKYLLSELALPPTTVQFWFSSYNLLLQTLAVAWLIRANKNHRAALERPRFRITWSAVLVGVTLVVADQFYFRALAQPGALVSVVSMVRRSNVLVSFLLARVVLSELHFAEKARKLVWVILGLLFLLLK